ncbi:MAG TPA: sugar ABC transporter substrate-binding protein [Thermomicrobiales bacterium]|jgi:multiple sugar transport system substrate-binding protein
MHASDAKVSRRRLLGYGAVVGAAGLAGVRPVVRAGAQSSVEIRLALYQTNDQWAQTFGKVVDAFQTANPAVKVKLEYRPGDQYWDKLQTEFAAGTAPDVTVNQMDWVVPGAARGMFESLSPYIERDKVDLSQYWYSHDLEWKWKDNIYGGLLYAGGQVLYVNKDLLDAAGVAFPADNWTWDDLRTAAKTLTIPDKNQWGLHFDLINPPYWGASFIHEAGGTVLNDARDACTLTTPEAQAGLQFLVDLIQKDKVMPVPGSMEGQENPFVTGKVALFFGGTWNEPAIRSAGFNWDYAHMPVHPATGKRSVQMGSNAWSMLSTSKHKDESWELIKYLMTEPGQRGIMSLGLPGITSLIESEDFKALHAPQNIDVMVGDLRSSGHNYYGTPDANEWWNAVDQELAPMWSGEADVATATASACDRISEIFSRRPPEYQTS